MKIKYLGTAATEAIPGPFCDCGICRRARELKGREIRSRSQALIDGRLLIEFNADTIMHMHKYDLDLVNIRHCIVTHVHTDHFYPMELKNLRPAYAELPEGHPPFTLYGSCDIPPMLDKVFEVTEDRLEVKTLTPYNEYEIDGFIVTPLKASHGTRNPFIYLISEKDTGKTLLYAHDTGLFPEATWDYLKSAKPCLELVSMDCTEGAMEDLNYDEHMCLGRNVKIKNALLELGLADAGTVFVSNHFSHSGESVNYCDYSPLAAKHGILTSYDGMEIEF